MRRLFHVTFGLTILLTRALAAGPTVDSAPAASSAAVAAYRQGLEKWQARQASEAEAAFERAAQLAPSWGAPYARLGLIAQLQGQEQQAREHYARTQTISVGPSETSGPAQARPLLIANEAYIVFLINRARLERGLEALVPDSTLGLVARRHSEEMRDKSYFSHTSPTPGLADCQDRFRAVFGYKPRLIGENIARRWGTNMYCLNEPKVHQSHVDLMNSQGHRVNILHPDFEWVGVGMAANANGDYWITEMFVLPGR
jgi:uncharacterized protein YkwD